MPGMHWPHSAHSHGRLHTILGSARGRQPLRAFPVARLCQLPVNNHTKEIKANSIVRDVVYLWVSRLPFTASWCADPLQTVFMSEGLG